MRLVRTADGRFTSNDGNAGVQQPPPKLKRQAPKEPSGSPSPPTLELMGALPSTSAAHSNSQPPPSKKPRKVRESIQFQNLLMVNMFCSAR